MYIVDQKAIPMVTNLANQLRACARVRACLLGLVCVRGVWVHVRGVTVSVMCPNVNKFDPCAGARGPPHPPGICYAIPTSFLYFLIIDIVYCEPLGTPHCSLLSRYWILGKKRPHLANQRGGVCEPLGETGGYRVYPRQA